MDFVAIHEVVFCMGYGGGNCRRSMNDGTHDGLSPAFGCVTRAAIRPRGGMWLVVGRMLKYHKITYIRVMREVLCK